MAKGTGYSDPKILVLSLGRTLTWRHAPHRDRSHSEHGCGRPCSRRHGSHDALVNWTNCGNSGEIVISQFLVIIKNNRKHSVLAILCQAKFKALNLN